MPRNEYERKLKHSSFSGRLKVCQHDLKTEPNNLTKYPTHHPNFQPWTKQSESNFWGLGKVWAIYLIEFKNGLQYKLNYSRQKDMEMVQRGKLAYMGLSLYVKSCALHPFIGLTNLIFSCVNPQELFYTNGIESACFISMRSHMTKLSQQNSILLGANSEKEPILPQNWLLFYVSRSAHCLHSFLSVPTGIPKKGAASEGEDVERCLEVVDGG